MAVVAGAVAARGEAERAVEGLGGGVGLADFEEEGSGLAEGGGEESPGEAAAAVSGIDGDVEDFGFVGGGLADDEEGGDVAVEFEDGGFEGEIAARVPLGGFAGGGLNAGDGIGVGVAHRADQRFRDHRRIP